MIKQNQKLESKQFYLFKDIMLIGLFVFNNKKYKQFWSQKKVKRSAPKIILFWFPGIFRIFLIDFYKQELLLSFNRAPFSQ